MDYEETDCNFSGFRFGCGCCVCPDSRQQTANGITVNAWGRGAFTPMQFVGSPQAAGKVIKDADGKDLPSEIYAGAGITWGGPQARVDFRINGNSDYVGFGIHSAAESGSIAGNDNGANLWVKPFANDYLKLTVGTFIEDALRGKVGNLDGGFSNFVLGKTPEEDAIFNRFGAGPTESTYGGNPASFMISSAPIDGVFIGLMVNGALWNWGGPGSGTRAIDAYRYLQAGAGYNIDGIGHVRAQYVGGWLGTIDPADKDFIKYYGDGENVVWSWPNWVFDDNGDLESWAGPQHMNFNLARIEFAFGLTAVEGLTVDLGAKIWMPLEFKDAVKISKGIDISVGANFNMDAIGVGFRADVEGLNSYVRGIGPGVDDKSANAMNMIFRLVPTYALDGATLGLDFAFAMKGASKDGKGDAQKDGETQLGFGLFAQKGLGSGNVKAGMSFTLPPSHEKGADGSSVFQIPIILEYAFF
jgi:hypothetical protein